MSRQDREFDIVVFGATGFTGRLVAEGRDLPVHHDFRAVLAQVLTRSLGVSRSAALSLFADMQWDTRLDALMRS